MVKIGNFLFHYRNFLFPVAYVLLFFKSPPVMADYKIALLLGVAVALLGQLIRAVTIGLEYIVRGGRNRQVYAEELVQGGIFAHCRNPLYLGNYLILVGVGIASNSLLFVSVGLPFFFFAYWAIISAEENYLRNKFGDAFTAYCTKVNRIIPRLSGIRTTVTGMHFNWGRLLTAEYGSTFIWIAAVILVTLKNIWQKGEYSTRDHEVITLWACFGAATICYCIARFLKKSGIVKETMAVPTEG